MGQVEQSIRQTQDVHSLNERSLSTLIRAIALAQGAFALITVNCNYRSLRQQILTTLKAETGWRCGEVWWRESQETLYQKLQGIATERDTKNLPALFCMGLEQTDHENVFVEANLLRDRLKQQIKCPIVLWLSDRELQKFWTTAPELANLAAPPIRFQRSRLELAHEISHQVQRFWQIASDPEIPIFLQDTMIDQELQAFSYGELTIAREELYLDRKSRDWKSTGFLTIDNSENTSKNNSGSVSADPEELQLEARLNFELGRLLWRSLAFGLPNQSEIHHLAQDYYQRSLDYWQTQDSPLESGIVLFYLGNLWWHYSFAHIRQTQPSWLQAKQFFQAAIASFTAANRLDLVAKYSRAYSGVLEQLKQWDELQTWVTSLLPMHQMMPLELAQDYGYLAKIAAVSGNWEEVANYCYQALAQLEAIPKIDAEDLRHSWLRMHDIQLGQTQLLLTQSYLQRQELDLAAKLIKTAIASFNLADEPKLYIRLLDTWHDIAFAQGYYLQAFQTRQQQRSLEQQYGMRAFIGAGMLQPKQLPSESNLTELDIRLAASTTEIAASGRIQDVERLVERIVATDNQITVIHGESGVGKSSLVNAGLIPALQQRSLTGQEILPIKVRVYTDWMQVIGAELEISRALSPELLLQKLRQIALYGTQIILIFDQFEEFFFTCTQMEARQTFIRFWQDCLQINSLKIVVSIREDYLHLLLELESNQNEEIDILSRDLRYALGNLAIADAKTLIENLTEHANFPLEPLLIDELVRDLAGDLGSVRPIELQLVGSQLQDRNITTLAAYHQVGGKQSLVEQSVQEVIKSCGKAAFIAQQVLILLTDEYGKRPLRNYNELRIGVMPYSSNTADLDLVLEILIGSGLVFQLPEISGNRYQLVHDYLVPFIRNNQESGLLNELQKVRSSAQRSQANLNRLTKFVIAGVVIGFVGMSSLAFQANRQRQIAEFGEVEALTSSANSKFQLKNELDALLEGLLAAHKLSLTSRNSEYQRIRGKTYKALQEIVYNIHERYRFYSQKNDSPFYASVFSPDGNLVASGSYSGAVYIHQRDGKLLTRLVGAKSVLIRGLSFSADGKRLAVGGKGSIVRIWDVANSRLLQEFDSRHRGDLNRVQLHANGRLLLTGSTDGTAKLWDLDRNQELLTLRSPEMANNPTTTNLSNVVNVVFSTNGQQIILAQRNVMSVWDLQGNLLASAIAHENQINSMAINPRTGEIASAGDDSTVKVWEIAPIEQSQDPASDSVSTSASTSALTSVKSEFKLLKTIKGNSTQIVALNFSKGGDRLALAYQDNSIQILSTDGTREIKLGSHTDTIFDVNFSPDGQYLLSASKDRTVRLWDLRAALINTMYGHKSNIWATSFHPNGKMFASGSVDKTIRIWRIDGTLQNEIRGHQGTVYGVSYSDDGKYLVSASADKTVKIWDSFTNQLIYTINVNQGDLVYATFSPDGKAIATTGLNGKITIWQWNDQVNEQGIVRVPPTLLHILEGVPKKEIWSIAFSPDSQKLASTGNDETVRIWDVKTGKMLHRVDNTHENGGLAIAFSIDGKQVISGGKDGNVKIWNVQTGTLSYVTNLGDTNWIYGLKVSPNGKLIAAAGSDKNIQIIDMVTVEQLKVLKGHTAEVNAIAFSLDGNYLVSASRDNSLKLWNAEILTLEQLVDRGCRIISNYLQYSPILPPYSNQICKS